MLDDYKTEWVSSQHCGSDGITTEDFLPPVLTAFGSDNSQ